MTPPADSERYKNHRFPSEIISHGVWLSYRFPLSYRDVQELLCERGITVTHEAIRQWCLKFGQAYANQLKHRRAHPGDKWHLDEVFLTIHGKRHYLWRAVDQDDNVLDILVQSRRNTQAAKRFFRKLLKGLTYVPRVIIPDKLKSYSAAKREILRDFCPRMAPLPNTSDPDGICCPRLHTVKRGGSASRVGLTLQGRSGPPQGWGGPGRGTRLPEERLSLNNLTKPSERRPARRPLCALTKQCCRQLL